MVAAIAATITKVAITNNGVERGRALFLAVLGELLSDQTSSVLNCIACCAFNFMAIQKLGLVFQAQVTCISHRNNCEDAHQEAVNRPVTQLNQETHIVLMEKIPSDFFPARVLSQNKSLLS
jgi:hypothetical protein